jgi:thiol-disulfide isomerase/thioredoxin
MRPARAFLLAALLVCAVSASAQPADSLNTAPMLPAAVASVSLPTADGGSGSISGAAGTNGLVVLFWSNVCPWAVRYTERVTALAERYVPAGIGFVAVNSYDALRNEHEGMERMQRTTAEAGFSFPYLSDADGAVARAFGVWSAPTAYFFDASGRLVYAGAIDDSPSSPSEVEVAYLEDAMDQHLAGRTVDVLRTAALGCTVRGSR